MPSDELKIILAQVFESHNRIIDYLSKTEQNFQSIVEKLENQKEAILNLCSLSNIHEKDTMDIEKIIVELQKNIDLIDRRMEKISNEAILNELKTAIIDYKKNAYNLEQKVQEMKQTQLSHYEATVFTLTKISDDVKKISDQYDAIEKLLKTVAILISGAAVAAGIFSFIMNLFVGPMKPKDIQTMIRQELQKK